MRYLFAVVAASLLLSACQDGTTYGNNPSTYKGAGIGAAIGGAAGALGGDNSRESLTRGAIGAGIGALAGGAIGQYMDRQEDSMRQQLQGSGVSVQRQGNDILLNVPNSITFNTDSSVVRSQFAGTLNNIAGILNQYPQTSVDVIGHTDNTGTDEHNQRLSEDRAFAVSSQLAGQGVSNSRLRAIGYGESQPIASNANASGRAQNRRVEIRVTPLQ